MADRVMRGEPAGRPAAIATGVQRKCAGCREEEEVHRKAKRGDSAPASHARAQVDAALAGPGRPLDPATRSFMETRFNYDFSRVRIHDGAAAAQSARDIGARAYTVGSEIVFGSGQFELATHEGRGLLAHELAHVVQQGSFPGTGVVMRKVAVDSTVEICRRELTSRNFQVKTGGVRVELLLDPLDLSVVNCADHQFWVTLKRYSEWWSDDDVSVCESTTGRRRTFLFGGVPPGEYYIQINRVFDHPYCCISGDILILDEPVSQTSSGCVPGKNLSPMDIVHGALDIAGFIPVLGAIPDLVNAGLYAVEGDWVNAGLSTVAAIPAYGDAVKATTIGGKVILKLSEKEVVALGKQGVARSLKQAEAQSAKIIKAESEAASGVRSAAKEAAAETKPMGKQATKPVTQAEKTVDDAVAKPGTTKSETPKDQPGKAPLEQPGDKKAAKRAAEKELKERIAKCEALHAAYKLFDCKSCTREDTPGQLAAKIACLIAEIKGRTAYLKERCDYILPVSVARGSKAAEDGHRQQLLQLQIMLGKCWALVAKPKDRN